MRYSLRRPGALISGLALYCVVMLLVSALASLPSPAPLLSQFGLNATLPRDICTAALLAAPVFALSLFWSYLTIRPTQRGRRPTTGWCLGGVLAAWTGWLMYGLVHASETSALAELPLSTILLSSTLPPLWGLLNVVAALLGVLLAGKLAKRWMPGKLTTSTQGGLAR